MISFLNKILFFDSPPVYQTKGIVRMYVRITDKFQGFDPKADLKVKGWGHRKLSRTKLEM